jgi:hypothetical protein
MKYLLWQLNNNHEHISSYSLNLAACQENFTLFLLPLAIWKISH